MKLASPLAVLSIPDLLFFLEGWEDAQALQAFFLHGNDLKHDVAGFIVAFITTVTKPFFREYAEELRIIVL